MVSLDTRLLRADHASAARARGRHLTGCAACAIGDRPCAAGLRLLSLELELRQAAQESARADLLPSPDQQPLF